MQVPNEDVQECKECHGPVVEAATTKRTKGQVVTVLLEVDEDQLNDTPGSQWFLTKVGSSYHAGQITNRNQRAGMIKNGQRFHLEHKATCARRKAGYR